MRARIVVGVIVVLAVAGLGRAEADTLAFTPSKDNTIYETAHNLSNGLGERIFAGTNAITDPRRALIAFDLTQIAPGSQITSVTLDLMPAMTATSDPRTISLHRATRDWGESSSNAGGGVGPGSGGGDGIVAEPGDATWSHAFYDTDPWANTGGDYVPSPSASTQVTTDVAPYTWNSPGMVDDIQGWVDDPGSNFGWFLIGRENVNRTAMGFASKDHSEPTLWPQLTIEYTPSTPVEETSMGTLKRTFGPRRKP